MHCQQSICLVFRIFVKAIIQFVLSGGSPSGGLYSGPGVNNGILDPAIAGSGVIAITYDYTDASGCTNFASQNITITAKPNVTFNTSTNFCEGDPAVNLSGGQPGRRSLSRKWR